MEEGRIRKRINFTLAEATLAKLDEMADELGSSRSKLIDISIDNLFSRYEAQLPLKENNPNK